MAEQRFFVQEPQLTGAGKLPRRRSYWSPNGSNSPTAPAKLIAENAVVEGSIIVREVEDAKGNVGFNASKGEHEDLVKAGVIDPAKVTKTALQMLHLLPDLLLTTEALIC